MGAHRYKEKQVALPKTPSCRSVNCKMMYKTKKKGWCVTEPQTDMYFNKWCYVDDNKGIWDYVSTRMRDKKYGCELLSEEGNLEAADCVLDPSIE